MLRQNRGTEVALALLQQAGSRGTAFRVMCCVPCSEKNADHPRRWRDSKQPQAADCRIPSWARILNPDLGISGDRGAAVDKRARHCVKYARKRAAPVRVTFFGRMNL